MKTLHRVQLKCTECEELFDLNVDLEKHMATHNKQKMFKCSDCEKEFHLEWRLSKHKKGHKVNSKFCHYFNMKKMVVGFNTRDN